MLDIVPKSGKATRHSPTAMNKAAQSELRLAKRMARLGTETAFEVLVKARALEAKGRDIVHLEIGEPDFNTLSQADSLIPRLNCEMINMPAPAIVAAQRHAHDHRSIGCHPAQSRIPSKKPRNAFFVIALRNFEPLNSFPELNRGVVIVDRKFSCANRVVHVQAPTTLPCTERL